MFMPPSDESLSRPSDGTGARRREDSSEEAARRIL
jgi:hypothetical protein